MLISDWSSDVCSSDLQPFPRSLGVRARFPGGASARRCARRDGRAEPFQSGARVADRRTGARGDGRTAAARRARGICRRRSEEHTSELQSLMRITYAVFCLKKKNADNQEQKKLT